MTNTNIEITALYKDHFGQLVALLLSRFPALSIESAEDVVQDTFVDAAAIWPVKGVPRNQPGWLYIVSKNKSINLLKKSGKNEELSSAMTTPVLMGEIAEHHFKDAQLQMLAACCHPHLPPKVQVVLALKYVANLKVNNIALQLGVHADAIEKMLYRAKQKIKEASLVLSTGRTTTDIKERLPVMHKVIYLIFSEGYQHGRQLCEEALILNKDLLDSLLCNTETKALQALLLFHIARFPARFDMDGNPVELENQDRGLWNAPMIHLARQYLADSEAPVFSPYHLEAAIANVHCSASTFKATNWAAICTYYEVLLKIYPSPFAQINYATSLLYAGQAEKAYKILAGLQQHVYFNRSPILNTALGKYFELMGKKEEAQAYFKAAQNLKSGPCPDFGV
jgi:RNA polymerase sigma factor (sigma-70 family)